MTDIPPPPSAPLPPEPSKKPQDGEPAKQALQLGLGLMIPMLLVSGPLVGYAIGYLLRRWLGWPEWVMYVMVLLGLVAGGRETFRVIKRIS